jgi:sialic acid synthase SpsE/quercetin dioxygenase-like cupin family protein
MGSLFSNPIFIFEMANNHMGDVSHGLDIINSICDVARDFPFRCGFKFQHRQLDTFVHPDFRERKDIKYVKRFLETRLTEEDFLLLGNKVRGKGFVSICTPFDEASVDLIEKHGFNVIKIASCSFTDWPLLERVARTKMPIIASTAGSSLEDIDKVVSFFLHREKDFALMHCVGEYPTGPGDLQLNQIDFLKKRFPDIAIGFSTHEAPDNFDAVKIAVAKGATLLEKHVGIPTMKYTLNAYSAAPEQVRRWLEAASVAFLMCGATGGKTQVTEKERADLRGLQRGVFAKGTIARDSRIDATNSFFAIPNADGQIVANDFSKYEEFTATREIRPNEPILFADVTVRNLREKVLAIINKIRVLLLESNIAVPDRLEMELSHHFGIDRFEEWGATIINCVNREYCKKLIILLPGQKHPLHHHRRKEETFHVLYGDFIVDLDGNRKICKAGDMIVVERGVKHQFQSAKGTIIEEISTTHYKDDSFYEIEEITNNKERKTGLTFWADWLSKPIH